MPRSPVGMRGRVWGVAGLEDLDHKELCGSLGESVPAIGAAAAEAGGKCAFGCEDLLGSRLCRVGVWWCWQEERKPDRGEGGRAHLIQVFVGLVNSRTRFMSWVASQLRALVSSLLPIRHLCYWSGQLGCGLERTERAGVQEGRREARLHLAERTGSATGL